jgi:exopolysaccharide production protein ExoY
VSKIVRGAPWIVAQTAFPCASDRVLSVPAGEGVGERQAAARRAIDWAASCLALIVLSPLLVLIAALITLVDGRPFLFVHERVGRHGQPFLCYKFRTMAGDDGSALLPLHLNEEAADEWAQRHKLRHDPRVTRLGRFLRRWGLDELPQLFNILRGDMALVGPRPITLQEVARYGEHFPTYAALVPGLTGYWQVHRQLDTPYEERVAMDVWYAKHRTIVSDLALLAATLPALIALRYEG